MFQLEAIEDLLPPYFVLRAVLASIFEVDIVLGNVRMFSAAGRGNHREPLAVEDDLSKRRRIGLSIYHRCQAEGEVQLGDALCFRRSATTFWIFAMMGLVHVGLGPDVAPHGSMFVVEEGSICFVEIDVASARKLRHVFLRLSTYEPGASRYLHAQATILAQNRDVCHVIVNTSGGCLSVPNLARLVFHNLSVCAITHHPRI